MYKNILTLRRSTWPHGAILYSIDQTEFGCSKFGKSGPFNSTTLKKSTIRVISHGNV